MGLRNRGRFFRRPVSRIRPGPEVRCVERLNEEPPITPAAAEEGLAVLFERPARNAVRELFEVVQVGLDEAGLVGGHVWSLLAHDGARVRRPVEPGRLACAGARGRKDDN